MLNEFLEFKVYVTSPKSQKPRVQPNMLTDYFSDENYLIGIEEIMTVIARGYIFSEDRNIYDESGKVDEKVINDTIELLHRWTGFLDSDMRKRTNNTNLDKWMKKYSVVDGWLKKYWLYWLGVKSENLSSNKKAQKWEQLEDKWNERLNSPMDYSVNKITYMNVIANALEKGPLRSRYFAFKKNEDQVGKSIIETDEDRFKYLMYKSGAHDTTYMKVMKLICTYLIFREFYPKGQTQVWVKSSELSRWYGLDDGKNGGDSWYPDGVECNEKPIYTINKLKGNQTKLGVDSEYLKKFDYRLIECDEVDKYRDEYWIFEDLGHGLENCWETK